MIVDVALYLDGRRIQEDVSSQTIGYIDEHPGSFAWVGLAQPTEAEIKGVMGSFELHETAVEDALSAQQRAARDEVQDLSRSQPALMNRFNQRPVVLRRNPGQLLLGIYSVRAADRDKHGQIVDGVTISK